MKIKINALAIACVAFALASCSVSRTSLGHYNVPVSNLKTPTKSGEACATYLFPFYLLFSDTDLTVEKARENADIKDITAIENRDTSSYPLYFQRCTIVRGN